MMRFWFFVILAIALLAGCRPAYEFRGVFLEEPRDVYDIAGIDQRGQSFLLSDFRGKYVLFNFGYTFCPDICPLTLAELARVYERIKTEDTQLAEQVEVVFVSVDPERDTVEKLEQYVSAFNADFRALNISDPERLDAAKESFGVYSETAPIEGNPDAYFVNHTGGIFVVNPDGKWILFYPHDAAAEDLVADLLHLLEG